MNLTMKFIAVVTAICAIYVSQEALHGRYDQVIWTIFLILFFYLMLRSVILGK